ncbi:MAG TPA: hypothetical protein VLE03_11570 [Nitrospiraceae bacterium]|nr:hypothetical protein [Nitrospiraceae bacterium]
MALTDALFYPFHLCHQRTLALLLERFSCVHFRDYMALQVGPFFGTTAYPDRMGDSFPEVMAAGRLKQGYNVSGPLNREASTAVDRDLCDPAWRNLFHNALREGGRFQRGLFDEGILGESGSTQTHEPSTLNRLRKDGFEAECFTVEDLRQLSQRRLTGAQAERFDYGLALLKTSASLVYTLQLAAAERLAVATDSHAHFVLLARMIERDGITIENHWIERSGY